MFQTSWFVKNTSVLNTDWLQTKDNLYIDANQNQSMADCKKQSYLAS